MPRARGKLIAQGMLRQNTPVEDYRDEYGLWVKREDLSCLPPGPAFSKTRGVYARVASRKESVIGVLDTYHSQAGHAVARACQILGKECVNFYPEYKNEPGQRLPQNEAQALGAQPYGLQAGRSCILFHQARKIVEECGGYMMPNALKLEESVEETAKEIPNLDVEQVLVPISSGTIAAGVIRGFREQGKYPKFFVHLGYSRSHNQVMSYLKSASGFDNIDVALIDEGYSYKDKSKPGTIPPWPCNEYYDVKAFRWWLEVWKTIPKQPSTLFWNIG